MDRAAQQVAAHDIVAGWELAPYSASDLTFKSLYMTTIGGPA
jgi:hypothetical protein